MARMVASGTGVDYKQPISNSQWVPEFADGCPASRSGTDQGLRN
jgi:hypothetical protein